MSAPICLQKIPSNGFYPGKCVNHHEMWDGRCVTKEQIQQWLRNVDKQPVQADSSNLMTVVGIATNFLLARGCERLNRITEALIPARFSKTIGGIKGCQFAAAIFIPAVSNVVKAVGAMDFVAEKITNQIANRIAVDAPADLFG